MMRRPPINHIVSARIAWMLALLPLVLGSTTFASAQEMASEVIMSEGEFITSDDEVIMSEGEALPADMILTEPGEFVQGVESICTACNWPTFGAYVKAGPTFQLGDGYFTEKNKVGYQVAFGAREPFLPNDRKFFIDFGAGYMSAIGRERPFTVEGTIDSDLQGPRALDDFLELRLREISRVGLHTAIGWYFDKAKCGPCNCRFAARVGGRLSHIRAHFDETATDDLQTEIDARIAAGEVYTLAKDRPFVQTDTSAGIFGGFEMAIDRRLSRSARLSFLIDGEISNDWIHLRGYAERGLPTASLLLGVNLSR